MKLPNIFGKSAFSGENIASTERAFAKQIEKIGSDKFYKAEQHDIEMSETLGTLSAKITGKELPVVKYGDDYIPLTHLTRNTVPKKGTYKDYFVPVLDPNNPEAAKVSKYNLPVFRTVNGDFSTLELSRAKTIKLNTYRHYAPSQLAHRIGTNPEGTTEYFEGSYLRSGIEEENIDPAGLSQHHRNANKDGTEKIKFSTVESKNTRGEIITTYIQHVSKNNTDEDIAHKYKRIKFDGNNYHDSDNYNVTIITPRQQDNKLSFSVKEPPVAAKDNDFNLRIDLGQRQSFISTADNSKIQTEINKYGDINSYYEENGVQKPVIFNNGRYYPLTKAGVINGKEYYNLSYQPGKMITNSDILFIADHGKIKLSQKRLSELYFQHPDLPAPGGHHLLTTDTGERIEDWTTSIHNPAATQVGTNLNGPVYNYTLKTDGTPATSIALQLIGSDGKAKRYVVKLQSALSENGQTTYTYQTIPSTNNWYLNGGPNSDHPTITFTLPDPVKAEAQSTQFHRRFLENQDKAPAMSLIGNTLLSAHTPELTSSKGKAPAVSSIDDIPLQAGTSGAASSSGSGSNNPFRPEVRTADLLGLWS